MKNVIHDVAWCLAAALKALREGEIERASKFVHHADAAAWSLDEKTFWLARVLVLAVRDRVREAREAKE